MMLTHGVKNILSHEFLDAPQKTRIQSASTHLYPLGMISTECKLTDLGIRIFDLPVAPMLAKTLAFSKSLEVVTIVSMLSAGEIFYSLAGL